MSNDAFKSMLDSLTTEDAPAAEAPPPVAPEDVPTIEGNGLADDDPYKHLVGRVVTNDEIADPFSAMLDGMLASEGMDKNTPTADKNPEAENHNWESDKDAIYEQDEILMTCSKCCRTMRVSRHESLNEAMDRHQVARDCSMQTVGEIMDT